MLEKKEVWQNKQEGEENKEKRRRRNGGLGDGKDRAMEELRDGGIQKDEGPKTEKRDG